MIRSNLCDYSDGYILVSGTITIAGEGADDAAKQADERNKGVIFNNCAPFTEYISNIDNTQIDNAKDNASKVPAYNLIECCDNYSKTSGSLGQLYLDEPSNQIANSKSFKSKIKITGNTPKDDNKKNVEIVVPLKYLSDFWRFLEMSLIDCEINLTLTWSENCVISSAVGKTEFALTDTKLYVPVVTLSTEGNIKLLKKLESGFNKAINWNRYQSK